jgi:AraC-like DNA-binding protein
MKPVREQLSALSPTELISCSRIRGNDFGCLWHFHPEFELTLCLAGGSHRWVGDRISPLASGDLVFLGSNLPHDYRNDPAPGRPTRPVDAVNVQFRPDFLGPSWLDPAEMHEISRLFQRSADGLAVTGSLRERTAERMIRMLEIHGVRRLILLLELLADLAGSNELERIASPGFAPEIQGADSERMGVISAFIQEKIDQPIYLADVAAHAGMSEITFSRYFRSRTGKTFPNYLNELRIARVCRLLVETDRTVSEIAWDCGFESLANFQKQFRKLHGRTPSEYRQQANQPRGR